MDDFDTIWRSIRCGVDDWSAFAGDPMLSGTIFMVGYGVTAWMMFRAVRFERGRERIFWRLCGLLFVFQVANTHLDLHGLVWTTGRCLAKAQGWYEQRREVQVFLLAWLAMVAGVILLAVLVTFLRNILGNLLLTLGVVTAVGFTVVKGINYHGLDQIYGGWVGPFRVADFIEFSGVVLAFLAALVAAPAPRSGGMVMNCGAAPGLARRVLLSPANGLGAGARCHVNHSATAAGDRSGSHDRLAGGQECSGRRVATCGPALRPPDGPPAPLRSVPRSRRRRTAR